VIDEDDRIRMPELPDDEAPPNDPEQLPLSPEFTPIAPYLYTHPACGMVAFGLDAEPTKFQNIMAMDKTVFATVDGELKLERQTGRGQGKVRCSHCGAVLIQLHARHVRPA